MPIFKNLWGEPDLSGYGGLFDPTALQALQKQMAQQQRMATAGAFLEAGGPSLTPINLGQAFGRALQARSQSGQQFLGQNLPLGMAMMQQKRLQAKDDQQLQDRAAAEEALRAGDYAKAATLDPQGTAAYRRATAPAGIDNPSAVQEWEYFKRLPQDQQEAYLRLKRAEQIKEIGGVQSVVGADRSVTPLGSLQGEVDAARAKAEASAQGRTQGEATGKAITGLPNAVSQADDMLGVIDGILSDPGLSGSVGLKGPGMAFGLKSEAIPGTKEADFQARLAQLQGKAFLEAFQSLKGGGQITEIEGKKATEAIARISNAQSEAAFKGAMRELKSIVIRAKARARQEAGVPDSPQGEIDQLLQQYGGK